MALNITVPSGEEPTLKPRITVVGVGGAGGNAVNNMIDMNLEGVEFVCANTDAQALAMAKTMRRIQLGHDTTQGLGAGARPEIGRVAAEEAVEAIASELQGSNMVFITAGMGGGTGTGAAPVVASVARELGVLTVGVVTKPFQFEGQHRARLAEAGIDELAQFVDTLIIIPNQNLFRVANERTTFADAFKMADDVLYSGVRSVTDLMINPGLINLDFADVRTVMQNMGRAMMGTGEADGERRALEAAEAAIANPLLEDTSMRGARGVLINITGGTDVTLYEVDEAANRIRDEVESEAHIIFGSSLDPSLEGRIRVSVVATGIDALAEMAQRDETQRSLDVRGSGPAQKPQLEPQRPAARSALPPTARAAAPQHLEAEAQSAPAAQMPAAHMPAAHMLDAPQDDLGAQPTMVAHPEAPRAPVAPPTPRPQPQAQAPRSEKAQKAVRMLESLVLEANAKQGQGGEAPRSRPAAEPEAAQAAQPQRPAQPMQPKAPAMATRPKPGQPGFPAAPGRSGGAAAESPVPMGRPRVPRDAFIPAPSADVGGAATARALDMEPRMEPRGYADEQPQSRGATALNHYADQGFQPEPDSYAPPPTSVDEDGWTVAAPSPAQAAYDAEEPWTPEDPSDHSKPGFRPAVVSGARNYHPESQEAHPQAPVEEKPAEKPSLLARITGLGVRAPAAEQKPKTGDANPLLSAKTLSPAPAERPAAQKGDDQLEIPTFLRRQVN
ncbi:MAG: cell division protein FtsZ [Rhodospirillaceae bacterium]